MRRQDIVIDLTADEYDRAVSAGERQFAESVRLKRQDHYNLDGGGRQIMIDGMLTEYAVAKWLGYPWGDPYPVYQGHPDYGALEIRGSRWHDRAGLFVHPGNPDHSPHVLVTGNDVDLRQYLIRGWCWGGESKKDEYWDEPQPGRGVYNVPRIVTNPNLAGLYAMGLGMHREQDIHHWETHSGAAPGRQLISVEWPNGFTALFSFPDDVDQETFEEIIEMYRKEVKGGKHSRLRASE